MTQQILVAVALISVFLFIGCGISAANSIEAQRDKKVGDILAIITGVSMLTFLGSIIILAFMEVTL